MLISELTAISPVDGRYRKKVEKLDENTRLNRNPLFLPGDGRSLAMGNHNVLVKM